MSCPYVVHKLHRYQVLVDDLTLAAAQVQDLPRRAADGFRNVSRLDLLCPFSLGQVREELADAFQAARFAGGSAAATPATAGNDMAAKAWPEPDA